MTTTDPGYSPVCAGGMYEDFESFEQLRSSGSLLK